MKSINRRQFLSQSTRKIMGAGLGALAGASKVLGSNERVRIALIGCGGRGPIVARGMIEQGAEMAYLCDLRQDRLEKTAKFLSQVQARQPEFAKTMRQVYDVKDVDAVIVATPDHWHAPAAILAMQAGKAVYVEKPHAHNIWESRKMIEAARKYKTVCQIGTQNRSAPYNHAARDYIKSGKIGDIRLVKIFNLKSGSPFRLGDPGKKPEGFDWDAWLGPAPARPFHQRIFGGGWHHFWDFSGGDLSDDAAHQIDLALMLMGDPGMPKAVSSSGGRLQHKDDSEVPDLLVSSYDFDGFVMTLEHSNYPRYMAKTTGTIRRNDEFPYWTQNATRIELYGSELLMIVGRHGGGWVAMTSGGRVAEKMYGRVPDFPHWKNFIDSVKGQDKPNAEIETLHPSCTLIHLANIAHRTGNRKLWFDSINEKFEDNENANKLIKRNYRPKYRIPEAV